MLRVISQLRVRQKFSC